MRIRFFVLIDFSPYSKTLLSLVERWSNNVPAEIVVVHQVPKLVPPLADSDSKRQILELIKEEALYKLKKLVNEAIFSPSSISYQISEKSLITTLPELLKQGSGITNLILVGLKGTGIIKKVFMGSTANQIIDELNHLTACIPIKHYGPDPKKLIVAVSHKYPFNKAAFGEFLDIFEYSLKEIEFISINKSKDGKSENNENLESLYNQYKNEISTSFRIFNGSDVFNEIKTYSEQNKGAFLVVQKGSRNLTDKFLGNFLLTNWFMMVLFH